MVNTLKDLIYILNSRLNPDSRNIKKAAPTSTKPAVPRKAGFKVFCYPLRSVSCVFQLGPQPRAVPVNLPSLWGTRGSWVLTMFVWTPTRAAGRVWAGKVGPTHRGYGVQYRIPSWELACSFVASEKNWSVVKAARKPTARAVLQYTATTVYNDKITIDCEQPSTYESYNRCSLILYLNESPSFSFHNSF